MAHTPYTLEILTPEGLVFSGEVEFISSRTETGSIGIYARHQPLLALLAPTELRVTLPGGEVKEFVQGEGYVQVSDERVLVLVEEAMVETEVDAEALQVKLDKAIARRESTQEGTEEHRRAERDERRYRVFLDVIGAKTAA